MNFKVKLLIFGQSNTGLFCQIPRELPTNKLLTHFLQSLQLQKYYLVGKLAKVTLHL